MTAEIIPLHKTDYLRQAYELIDSLLDDELSPAQLLVADKALELIQKQIEVTSAGLLPTRIDPRPVH